MTPNWPIFFMQYLTAAIRGLIKSFLRYHNIDPMSHYIGKQNQNVDESSAREEASDEDGENEKNCERVNNTRGRGYQWEQELGGG